MQQCLSYHPPTDTYSSSVKSFQLSGVLDPFARHIRNPILNVSGKNSFILIYLHNNQGVCKNFGTLLTVTFIIYL